MSDRIDTIKALNWSLHDAMAADGRVIVFGEEVASVALEHDGQLVQAIDIPGVCSRHGSLDCDRSLMCCDGIGEMALREQDVPDSPENEVHQ